MKCSFCLKEAEDVKPVVATLDNLYRVCKHCIPKLLEVVHKTPDYVTKVEVDLTEKKHESSNGET